MRKRMSSACRVVCLAVILGSSSPALAETWTETFETGVGRLNQTSGNGDTVFVHDPSTQSIDATFVRYLHGTPADDQRFALLEGGPFDFGTAVAKYTMVVTPISGASGANVSAKIGLFDFAAQVSPIMVLFEKRSQTIFPQFGGSTFDPVVGIPFSYGETYFVAATLDGPGRRLAIDVYRGVDAAGDFLGEIDREVPDGPLVFNAFGLPRGGTASSPSQIRVLLHELSLDIPTPVEWSVADGGNCHFYEFVEAPLITWSDARAAAASREHNGMPGHLLTSTSLAENNFVRDLFADGTGTFGWIGASDSTVEGDWRWVEGPESGIQFWQGDVNGTVTPPFNYANWAGQDPTGEGQNWAVMALGLFQIVQPGEWGDADNSGNGAPIVGYFVEYSGTDCNGNGIADECDIADGESTDFNDNGIPDECEPDCQPNEIPDFIEIGLGLSEDCNLDDVPDECQLDDNDCNTNGIPDDCENNSDEDDIIDACDNCVLVSNPSQSNSDGDELGDACDPDIDNDGVDNESDVCDFTPTGATVDFEGRSLGDIDQDCDTDLDDYKLFQLGFTGPTPAAP